MRLYKYQGAGNDFLVADNRDGSYSSCFTEEAVASLCDRRYGIGADGLMLLEKAEGYDFSMVYYNSDGSGGMMCGNGGRCIVAFAADCGLGRFSFIAPDGPHEAQILAQEGRVRTVRLKMKDVSEIREYADVSGIDRSEGYFLDTGTRHFVNFVQDSDDAGIIEKGRSIRWAEEFAPTGTNVNFVRPCEGGIMVRTFEKGVEDETYACGTGIVASSLASYVKGIVPSWKEADGRVHYRVRAKRDILEVDFMPGNIAEEVWLTGPAAYVAEIEI